VGGRAEVEREPDRVVVHRHDGTPGVARLRVAFLPRVGVAEPTR
jgi:hypothetical protein